MVCLVFTLFHPGSHLHESDSFHKQHKCSLQISPVWGTSEPPFLLFPKQDRVEVLLEPSSGSSLFMLLFARLSKNSALISTLMLPDWQSHFNCSGFKRHPTREAESGLSHTNTISLTPSQGFVFMHSCLCQSTAYIFLTPYHFPVVALHKGLGWLVLHPNSLCGFGILKRMLIPRCAIIWHIIVYFPQPSIWGLPPCHCTYGDGFSFTTTWFLVVPNH